MVTERIREDGIRRRESEFSSDSSRCGNHSGWNGQRTRPEDERNRKKTRSGLKKNEESYCAKGMFGSIVCETVESTILEHGEDRVATILDHAQQTLNNVVLEDHRTVVNRTTS